MTTPTKFIHLTDPHVIGGDCLLYGANPARRLARAVDSIIEEHGDAAFVIVTGDMTHWGDADAYVAFAREIHRLPMPVHLMVGNHDDGAAFTGAFPHAPRDRNGFVQYAFDTPHHRAIYLDTKMPGTHAGGYCAARREWLAAQLAEADRPVLLFMHHPPFQTGIKSMDSIMMLDSEPFHETVAPYKDQIQHLFFGHVHRAIFGNWRGISFSCMRGLNHQVGLDLGPAGNPIPGDLAQPAYGVVLLSDDTVVVHMHEFAAKSPRFTLSAPDGTSDVDYQLNMRHEGFQDL
ncbi:phosphodiesterase [Thalassovita aquimarina]|uniref:Phosphodiesterase n=1 Tax=Thalassovita aquimarina TaxID=2785917 RepID=A0ABS5HVI5_9RHOB|nr:phosphodiesterase [Thalassovita aquimarina]MBR9652982.1 phosphodiesterase [Thalassovita aquimarina]